MKAIFVENGIEYRFETTNSRLVQGEPFESRLCLRNRHATPQRISSLCLALQSTSRGKGEAEGIVYKAFSDLPWTLQPGEERSVDWSETIPPNCPLGEKGSELAFVLGADAQALYRMPCLVELHPLLIKLTQLMESLHQFPFKGARSAKGWTELKFKPSESTRYSTVEDLTLAAQFSNEGMQLKWKFKVKKFSATSSALSVGKAASEVQQSIPEQCLDEWKQGCNEREVLQYIDEALAQVASNF